MLILKLYKCSVAEMRAKAGSKLVVSGSGQRVSAYSSSARIHLELERNPVAKAISVWGFSQPVGLPYRRRWDEMTF